MSQLHMCLGWNGGRMDRYFNYMTKYTHVLAVKLPFKSKFASLFIIKIWVSFKYLFLNCFRAVKICLWVYILESG